MTTAATAATIRAMGAAVTKLADHLAHAEEVQYLKPAAPSTRADTPDKAKGGISRPTEEIATDPRRLRVRSAVIAAEVLAEDITVKANEKADELAAALVDWAGVRA